VKKSELTHIIRAPYTEKRGYGTVLGDEPGWENLCFVVPPPPPKTLDEPLPLRAIADANRALTVLPSYTEMGELEKLINYLFVRREAMESSRMEGTWSTIDEVLASPELSEVEERSASNVSVRGYAHSVETALLRAHEKNERVFSLSLVKNLHKEIVTHDPKYQAKPGELRRPNTPGGVVTIGGMVRKEDSFYNPAPPQHVERCLGEVLEWLRDEELAQRGDAGVSGMTLPVRLAVSHAHFEAVHPFPDGNGRVGRALWPIQMVVADYMPLYLSGYIEKEKSSYVEALQQAQKKLKYAPLIEVISLAITSAEREMLITKEVLQKLPEVWRERASPRKRSAAERALKILVRNPILTVNDLMSELSCSFEAANNALNRLTEHRILRERTNFQRNRVFAAEEVLTVLGREFGSDIDVALESGRRILGFGEEGEHSLRE
jgi:Fic family protein